nr:immunoglobulin heavy chain junction region [Macaca mulatta]
CARDYSVTMSIYFTRFDVW